MKKKKGHVRVPSVIVVALTIILFCANFTTAFATDTMDNVASDATIVTGDSATSDGSITPRSDAESYITKTLVSTAYKKMVFLKYLDSSWSKTSSQTYTVTGTLTFSCGYSYEGANLSIGFSKSISTTISIPTDPTRWSRIAAFADFTIKKYLVKRYTTGGVLLATSYSYTTITTASYIDKKYQ